MKAPLLPTINASLNVVTTCLLLMGLYFIKKRQKNKHKICMISAGITSTVFLVLYLVYHSQHGITRFPEVGLIKKVYLAILTSHTILAALQVPLIVATFILAARGSFEKHKRVARITYPMWLFVSVTGVIVYLMLYKLSPPNV